jgi:hypothetical protein
MILKRQRKLFVAGFGVLTGIAGYGCWVQGNKYVSSKRRWERLDYYIDNYSPVDIKAIDM